MNFETYSREFITKALNAGYSSENITKCLNYARPLLEKKLPVIYDLSHFSVLVGYSTRYITHALIFTPFYYRRFQIKKHNGSLRTIAEPLPSLKEILQWILNNVLYALDTSKFAKAYKRGMTLKQNLVFHKEQPFVLSLDIKDFFSSIRRPEVENIFHALGYSALVANFLAKICCLDNCLPQGASTSPCLSNIFLRNFDDTISGYCIERKIRYTRYADDLSFSGVFNYKELIKVVETELATMGLYLNRDKTKLMKASQRQIVTGVVVNKKLQVVRSKRKKIRQTIYYIKKFGVEEHQKKTQSQKQNFLQHLRGEIQFVLFINPTDDEFQEYKKYINSLIHTTGDQRE